MSEGGIESSAPVLSPLSDGRVAESERCSADKRVALVFKESRDSGGAEERSCASGSPFGLVAVPCCWEENVAPHCEQAASPFPTEPHRGQIRAGVNSMDGLSPCWLRLSAIVSRGA
jgi:hypothetical protein